jgi:hypothetical protein
MRENPVYREAQLLKDALAKEKKVGDQVKERALQKDLLKKYRDAHPTENSAQIRTIEFRQGRHADDGTFMVGIDPLSHYRRASRVVPWINRAGQAAGDLGDMAVGKKVKDPFYRKSWFKRMVQTAAIAVPSGALALGVHRRSAKYHGDTPIGESPDSGRIAKAAGWVGKQVDEKFLKKIHYAAQVKVTELVAKGRGRLVELDYASDLKGWDLRDPRGKSARVFAPGSGKRQRREKTPAERIDRIRLIRNLALAGTAAGIGGTLYYRNKAKKLTPVATTDVLGNVIPLRSLKEAAAKVNPIEFRRKETPALHKVIDAMRANSSVMENKRARRGVLRILGAGTVGAGGVLGGVLTKRPKTGAALGGLGAGWILRG